MICPECAGQRFEHGLHTIVETINESPVAFVNTPAEECQQCGYLVLDSSTMGNMERALSHGARMNVVIPAYDMQPINPFRAYVMAYGNLPSRTYIEPERSSTGVSHVDILSTAGVVVTSSR